jgi:hypothetical protein
MLVDEALAQALMPWSCPCDFGPSNRYRLEELIGAGRNSLVYRATDRHLSSEGFNATVAIKIIRSGGAAREALATRRISHPSVLAVLDHGLTEDGSVYIVSEHVLGGDLSQSALPWPPARAAAFVFKLARGVQAAHTAGVIHCDLKPANILITDAGDPKLVDFDLARWGDDEGSARGNLAFMAPEQYRGEPSALAPPADVYALGGILYYLLTGSLPNGSDRAQVAAALNQDRPAPSPNINRDLDAICQRALQARRENRHHSAGELADDLDRWLRHQPIPWLRTGPARRAWLLARRRPVKTVVAAALALGVIAAAAALQYNISKARNEAIRINAEAWKRTRAEVEAVSARARNSIRFYAQSVVGGASTDLPDRMLPMLVWMQLITDSPVLSDDARVPSLAEREHMLQIMVDKSEADGRADHLDAILSKYALAHFLICQGRTDTEHDGPRHLLADVRARLNGKFPAEDPIWPQIRGLEACAAANETIAAGGPLDQARADLLSARTLLSSNGRCDSVVRVADEILRKMKPAK